MATALERNDPSERALDNTARQSIDNDLNNLYQKQGGLAQSPGWDSFLSTSRQLIEKAGTLS
jgi:hypothetical protein